MSQEKITEIDILNAGFRYALALTASQQDSEDLVQAAWLRLYKRYGATPDKPLLYRTIRNLFIDGIRRNNVESAYLERLTLDHSVDYEDQSGSEMERELASASVLAPHLAKLNDGEREMLFLSVIEGYTADEIAALTKKVRGTVLSTLHRSKSKLRNWIEKAPNTKAKVIDINRRKSSL